MARQRANEKRAAAAEVAAREPIGLRAVRLISRVRDWTPPSCFTKLSPSREWPGSFTQLAGRGTVTWAYSPTQTFANYSVED